MGASAIPMTATLGTNTVFDDDCDATPVRNLDKGPTELRGIYADNGNAAIEYLHLWNKTGPAVGSDAQDFQIPIAASSSLFFVPLHSCLFDLGFSFACTSDSGTSANTDPAAPLDVYAVTTGGTLHGVGTEIVATGATGSGGAQVSDVLSVLGGTYVRDEVPGASPVAAKGSSGTLYAIVFDNSDNSVDLFLKFYDDAAPTVGTDDPYAVFMVPAGKSPVYVLPTGIAFATAITYAMVKTGGTAGAAAPDNAVPIGLYLG